MRKARSLAAPVLALSPTDAPETDTLTPRRSLGPRLASDPPWRGSAREGRALGWNPRGQRRLRTPGGLRLHSSEEGGRNAWPLKTAAA